MVLLYQSARQLVEVPSKTDCCFWASPQECKKGATQISHVGTCDLSCKTWLAMECGTTCSLQMNTFEDGEINSENMLKALAQFMTMLTSSNSKFDKYRRNETGGTLSSDELAGYAVFNQKCASCHATDIFTDNSFRGYCKWKGGKCRIKKSYK